MRTVCLSLVLLSAQLVSAQTPPDAKALLERERTALDSFTSYQYEEKATMSMIVGGMPANIEMTTSVKAVNPGKRRTEMRMAGVVASTMIADGRTTWIFIPTANQYMKLGDDPAIGSAVAGGLNGLTQIGQLPSGDAKIVRSETVHVDGTAHECWVVESHIDQLSLGFMELRNATVTSWIDKKINVSLRQKMSGRFEGALAAAGGGALEMQLESVKVGLAFNEALPDSLFVFTPPPGATEIDLAGGGISGFSLTLEPAAPTGPPAAPLPPPGKK